MVSDLQGSTALAERLDPESLRLVLDRYFDELGAVLEAHGGRIEKRIGDAMVTLFGLPDAAGDDARRAVRAVAETQAALAGLNERLERTWGVRLTNRTGVGSGRVVIADAGVGHRVVSGPALEAASALEPAAPPFEALLDPETVARLDDTVTVGPVTEAVLKSGAVAPAHRLVAVASEESGSVTPPTGRCPACGAPAPPPERVDEAPWCTACGTRLATSGRDEMSRRTLTIVFADVRAPSDAEPEAARAAVVACFDAARAILERHGGVVEKFIGDAVMAVFGLDRRHEDDALRAVRAALEMQARLEDAQPALVDRLGVRLEARIGVNTGPVIAANAGHGQRLVTGDAVNVAARLEQAAGAGEVLLGPLTHRLCADAIEAEPIEPLRLKGKSQPVPAWRAVSAAAGGVAARVAETPMTGRREVLERLRRRLDETVEARQAQWVAVVGDAGIGKSRLVAEFTSHLMGSVRVLHGSCLPYGEGITFWPVAEALRELAGIGPGDPSDVAARRLRAVSPSEDVAARVASLLGLVDETFPLAELFWAVRRTIEHHAAEGAVVLVIDGLHWAEPTLLELLDHLVDHHGGGAVLVVTMSRPDDGVDLAAKAEANGRPVLLELEPLDDAQLRVLVANQLGGELPAAVQDQVARASGGNPLFAEQLVAVLLEDGRIERRDGAWVLASDDDRLEVPPTVEALLAARVDALDGDQQAALASASVIGPEFGREAVAALTSDAERVAAALVELLVRQIVAPAAEPTLLADHRFTHGLLRDVVYTGLLKETRSRLHGGFAEWLERVLGSRTLEVEEILGYHLEQAFLLRTQLGVTDDATVTLGARACTRLAAAGERAFARGDMPAAANLLGRAAAVAPAMDRRRARLLVRSGEARFETGAFADAIDTFARAGEEAEWVHDDLAAAAAELAACTVGYLTGNGVDNAAAEEVGRRLLPRFQEAGDGASEARCWRLLAYVALTRCRYGEGEAAAAAALAAARRGGDAVLEQRLIPAISTFAVLGPTPVPEAIARTRDALGTATDRRGRALVERGLGRLLALDGDVEEGRARCAATRAALLELGWNFDAALVSLDLGPLELAAGRPAAAEAELRADHAALDAMGERNYIATTAALLAEAVRAQGRDDEALAHAEFSAAVASDDDVLTQVLWRLVRARVLAARGTDAAVQAAADLVDRAVALASETDDLSSQGDAFVVACEVREAQGDRAGAVDAARRALAAYGVKGHRPGIAAAEAHLAALGAGPDAGELPSA